MRSNLRTVSRGISILRLDNLYDMPRKVISVDLVIGALGKLFVNSSVREELFRTYEHECPQIQEQRLSGTL